MFSSFIYIMTTQTNDNVYNDKLLKLKTMEQEYSIAIGEYAEAKKNYMDLVNKELRGEISYSIIKDSSLFGEELSNFSDINDVNACATICDQNKKDCFGATYISDIKKCNLISNKTQRFGLFPDESNYSSIVLNSINKIIDLLAINNKLIQLNADMMQLIDEISPTYSQDIIDKKNRSDEMYKNYKILMSEREYINAKMNEFNAVSSAYATQNIYAHQQYNLLTIWIFIAIVAVIFALQQMIGFSFNYTILFIFILAFIFGLNLGTPISFLVWIIVLVIGIFVYYKNTSNE
jgi:hypothetical protein